MKKKAFVSSFQNESELLIDSLQDALQNEFRQVNLYETYKGLLIGLNAEKVIKHFDEHIEEEKVHIEGLQKYISAAGFVPVVNLKDIPQLKDPTLEKIIALQVLFEKKAVENYKSMIAELEEKLDGRISGLKITLEEYLAKEIEHEQDMILLLMGRGKGKNSI